MPGPVISFAYPQPPFSPHHVTRSPKRESHRISTTTTPPTDTTNPTPQSNPGTTPLNCNNPISTNANSLFHIPEAPVNYDPFTTTNLLYRLFIFLINKSPIFQSILTKSHYSIPLTYNTLTKQALTTPVFSC